MEPQLKSPVRPAKKVPANVEIVGGNSLALNENEDTQLFLETLAACVGASEGGEEDNAETRAAQGLFKSQVNLLS